MSDLEQIQKVLAQAGRRRRSQRALNGLTEGALVGGIVFLLALAAYNFLPLPGWVVPAAGGVAVAAAVLGLLIRGWRAESLLKTARWIDDEKNLKERLSTALEVSNQPAPAEWKNLVLADASRHAAGL